MFEDADRDPALIDQGALNFVVIGGGPTGVEFAGALADLIHQTMTAEFHDLAVSDARIHIVDLGHTLLGPFSDRAHDYVAKVLGRKGVRLHLGSAVTEIGPGHVKLSDGTRDQHPLRRLGRRHQGADHRVRGRAAAGARRAHRRAQDLAVDGSEGVYAVGDVANIPAPDGGTHPQLGSIALQSGAWAADNIVADTAGKPARASTTTTRGSWR